MDEIALHIWGMEFNVLVLLVTVAIVGGMVGYYLGRRKSRQDLSLQPSRPPEDYTAFLEGIQYILANETDQAIEAFTRAVQINSETIETYVALGNLFRAKGEIDRAIRIRQSILLREKGDPETKLQALFDLGMDYKQGGFLQRAISTFEEVVRRAPGRLDAYVELEALCEATRDWQRAYELQKEICKLSNRSEQHVLAHLRTEQAKSEIEKGRLDAAKTHLKKALSLDSNCVDAQLQLGELYWLKNKKKKALSTWRKLVLNNSKWAHLVLVRLLEKQGGSADEASVLDFLENISVGNLDAAARLAMARCFMELNRKEQCFEVLKRALEIEPDLGEARKMFGELLLEDGNEESAVQEYRELLRHLGPVRKRYRCQQCGLETDEILWKCPGCHNWDTVQPRKSTNEYIV
jgi:lipopolysaccharide biosynthesis regulator YciM